MSTDVERTTRRSRRNHWVLLDRSWARRLGVKRSAGVYRIRSHELFRRMAQERAEMAASGQVINLGKPDERRPQPAPARSGAPASNARARAVS